MLIFFDPQFLCSFSFSFFFICWLHNVETVDCRVKKCLSTKRPKIKNKNFAAKCHKYLGNFKPPDFKQPDYLSENLLLKRKRLTLFWMRELTWILSFDGIVLWKSMTCKIFKQKKIILVSEKRVEHFFLLLKQQQNLKIENVIKCSIF